MQLRDAGVPYSPPSFDYGADALELLRQLDREASSKGALALETLKRGYASFLCLRVEA